MKVAKDDRQRIKDAVEEEAKNFCDMIDYVDDPPALDYKVERNGVKIRIVAETN